MLLQHIDSLSVADAIIQNAVEFSEIVIRLHRPFRIGKRPPVFRFFVKRRLVLNIQRMDIRLRIINKTDAAAAIGHFLPLAHCFSPAHLCTCLALRAARFAATQPHSPTSTFPRSRPALISFPRRLSLRLPPPCTCPAPYPRLPKIGEKAEKILAFFCRYAK